MFSREARVRFFARSFRNAARRSRLSFFFLTRLRVHHAQRISGSFFAVRNGGELFHVLRIRRDERFFHIDRNQLTRLENHHDRIRSFVTRLVAVGTNDQVLAIVQALVIQSILFNTIHGPLDFDRDVAHDCRIFRSHDFHLRKNRIDNDLCRCRRRIAIDVGVSVADFINQISVFILRLRSLRVDRVRNIHVVSFLAVRALCFIRIADRIDRIAIGIGFHRSCCIDRIGERYNLTVRILERHRNFIVFFAVRIGQTFAVRIGIVRDLYYGSRGSRIVIADLD